jgi:hypothetical protein
MGFALDASDVALAENHDCTPAGNVIVSHHRSHIFLDQSRPAGLSQREGLVIKATGFPIVDRVHQGLRPCGHVEYAVEAT